MSALEPIMVTIIPRVAESLKIVLNEITHVTDFKLCYLLHPENTNRTHKDLNTSIDEPESRWNIHLDSYDTLISRAKPSSNGQLCYCSWSFRIFDQSHQYKTKNSVGWRIVMNARIEFKLHVTGTLGFHSLHDWYFHMMWLFSGAPEYPMDNTVVEMHGAEALYSTVEGAMYAIWMKDEEAQQEAAHQMIEIAKPCTIQQWSESKLPNGRSLIRIPKDNPHHIHHQWTEEEQAHLKTLGERYTLQGASGARRVHRWWLACLSLLFGDTDDCNHHSGQWQAEWPLDKSDCSIAERDIAANACQGTCGVSQPWPRQCIKRDSPSRREKWKCTAQCTSSTKGSAILSSSWRSLSSEVVANKVFDVSCGYIPHVCWNGQWWMHRNAAHIPGFTKSLCINNHTQSGCNSPRCYSCRLCSNNSEILGIEWTVGDICTSCLARAKPSTSQMVGEYGSRWVW